MQQHNLIDYWSYSSMGMFLRNPLAFKKRYILKVYADIISPTGLVGRAAHKAVESYLNGMEMDEAIGIGMEVINQTSDSGINYGKTGSRQKMLETYTNAVNFYFAEFKMPHEILGVEEGITQKIKTIDGQDLGLPAKGFMDLVTRNELGEIEIIDHKFSAGYSAGDVENPVHFLQAMFNYHLVLEHYGEAPARIIFNECKVTKNRDGSPQIQPYTIEFNQMKQDFAVFYKLYDGATRLLNLEGMVFLPNLSDMFDGQDSFESFRLGVIGIDRPTAVSRKTEAVAFSEKQYIPSAGDRVENEALSPEERIRLKLQEFGMPVEMNQTHIGPSVTQYTLKPARGIPMSKFARMSNDIALALESEQVRIDAPIKGTNLVGVEVPNKVRTTVPLAESHFISNSLNIPIGVDVRGNTVHKDLSDMPHLLIAGATGSGKSVMLNVLLQSLIKQNNPEALKLVLIDPKQVELTQFEGEPHLYKPVVTNNIDAAHTLNEMVEEMDRRYKVLRKAGKRSIDEFRGKMPKIVIVLDEFADLMMTDIAPSVISMDIKRFNENLLYILEESKSGKLTQKATKEAIKMTIEQTAPPSAEHSIIRIAQKARAVGIHLVLATQRPSADVVTGLIKANIPTKIAFMTTSGINSRVILDVEGAEKLTGKGDMLFMDPSARGLQRLQGLYS